MDSSTEKNSAGGTCEFQQNLEILRQIEFFAGLPMETLKVFAYLCTRESFSAEEYLYTKDDDDGQAFYILSGRLVLVHDSDGGEEIIQATLSVGYLCWHPCGAFSPSRQDKKPIVSCSAGRSSPRRSSSFQS